MPPDYNSEAALNEAANIENERQRKMDDLSVRIEQAKRNSRSKPSSTIRAVEIAGALNAQRAGEGQWVAKCPAHDDKTPSLSISDGDNGTVLVHCFAGCSQTAVIDALRLRGLWPDATPQQRLAAERREHESKRNHAEIVKAIGEAEITSGKSKEWSAEDRKVYKSSQQIISRKEDTYGFKRLGDLLLEPEEDLEWVVDNILLSGGTAILSGRPKGGKSTLARALALNVARGEHFLGRPTTKGTVLYLGMEEKPSQVRAHFKSMGGNADDNIYIYCKGAPEEPLIWLTASIAKYKPILIIVDTMQRLTRVKDTNDYAVVANALEPVIDLARSTGAHLLLTHHTGRANGTGVDAPMGSTAIAGAFDTLLNLNRKGDMRTIASVQRYGVDLEETVIVKADNGCVMAAGSRKNHEEHESADAIISFLAENPGADQQQIRDGVEGHRITVIVAALRRLVDGQALDRKGAGKRGDPYLYSLSEKASLLVPTIYREPENQKRKNGENPYFSSPDSGSRNFADSSKPPDQREPETGTQDPSAETAPRAWESEKLRATVQGKI